MDLSPSTALPSVTYVDNDARAAKFFAEPDLVSVDLAGRTVPGVDPDVRFLAADYTQPLDVPEHSMDLLISLYAGPVWDNGRYRLATEGRGGVPHPQARRCGRRRTHPLLRPRDRAHAQRLRVPVPGRLKRSRSLAACEWPCGKRPRRGFGRQDRLMEHAWTIEIACDGFERFMRKLPAYERDVVDAALGHVLAVEGIGICDSEWGKALGGGLYEFRVRRSLAVILNSAGVAGDSRARRAVLVRVLCAFSGNKVVILLGGYDKGRDPSAKRQQREIAAARATLSAWKRAQRS